MYTSVQAEKIFMSPSWEIVFKRQLLSPNLDLLSFDNQENPYMLLPFKNLRIYPPHQSRAM